MRVAAFSIPVRLLAAGSALLGLALASHGPAVAADDLPQVPGISLHGTVDDTVQPSAPPAARASGANAPAAAPADQKPAATTKSTSKASKSSGEKKSAAKKPDAPADASPGAASDAGKSKASTSGSASSKKGGPSSIAILVNDEPITGYEIDQRAAFIALTSGAGGDAMKAKAEARWKAIISDPKTNERLKQLFREKGVTTQEEAREVQTQFVKNLQKDMLDGLRREARASAVAGSRTKAQDELIDEKLKLQEAKKLSAVASDADVDKFVGGIAERNKMTIAQFGEHLKGMGVDISTMRSRFLADISWREVIRKRFGHQISISDHDVDRAVANASGGEDDVELQLQRISLFLAGKADQKQVAQRLSEAQTLAAKFTDCKTTRDLTGQVAGARFQDMGSLRPATIPEPTRSMLLNARDGDILPPVVAEGGVELWVVCGRKVVTANEQKREEAEADLRQKEFEIMAKKHLKDLRNDAAIEYR